MYSMYTFATDIVAFGITVVLEMQYTAWSIFGRYSNYTSRDNCILVGLSVEELAVSLINDQPRVGVKYRLDTHTHTHTRTPNQRTMLSEHIMLRPVSSARLATSLPPTATNKKHLKNVGPIRHCEPPSFCIAIHQVLLRRLRIDVHDNDDDDNNDNE